MSPQTSRRRGGALTRTWPAPEAGAPFAHPALFYDGDREYLDGTVAFLRDGLAAGEPAAVAVPGPRLAPLREALGADAARITWLDMTRAGRNPGRIIPGVLREFADRHGDGGRARIIGEPVWPGRTDLEYPACARYEALINLAFAGRPVTILCPYDVAGLAPDVLADARATHPTLIDRHGTRASDAYAPEHVISRYNRRLPVPVDADLMAFDLDALPEVRRFTCERAAAFGLDPVRVGDLELVVNELAANSVVHGLGAGVVRVWAEGGQVVCEVRDGGMITDPLAGLVPVRLGTDGGRGLIMVNHLADLVRVHTGPDGTTVRVHLDL
ncbi:sensor histidine kinase [Actinomadura hibisca]|uniref:sensor histidine kinase n=1 Tax=Actinomadura hibisca TaxID=68565 RepID=UPI0008319BA6|nr:sensor histidine kinase [Actinomadura hibisca]